MHRRLGATDMLNGAYLASVIDGLMSHDLLTPIAAGEPLRGLAERRGLHPGALADIVAYISACSDILEADPSDSDCYHLGASYRDVQSVVHMVELYHGAFGICVARAGDYLSDPIGGAALVDWRRHGEAFASASRPDCELLSLLRELGAGTVLDLGCGSGLLLHELGKLGPEFQGIGLDENEEVLRRGQSRLDADSASGWQVRLLRGSLQNLTDVIDANTLDRVDVVVAASVMNAFFADPADSAAKTALHGLRASLPMRLMIISDYYGRLHAPPFSGSYARTYLHDLAQLLSGQGIPPSCLSDWQKIYDGAGVTLIKALDMAGPGIDRFIHLIQLG